MPPTEMINEHAENEARLQYLRDVMLRRLFAAAASDDADEYLLSEFDNICATLGIACQ